jgi:flavin-dependent dehydrogenase
MGITLEDGSKVAVIGGGPAGSLCAYFLLTFARRMDLHLEVDIYEPRDFAKPAPTGCNMCGGIVSESLIQALAVEGINLPSSVVQRGVDSYILHTDDASLKIDTPLHEKRIAAVHRGGGPRDVKEVRWQGLDGHLLGLARGLGAQVIQARVTDVAWEEGRPQVRLKDTARTYDLLVGAVGVNSSGWQLFEKLGLPSPKARTAKTYITELNLGDETVTRQFGSSMHMFLLQLPRLEFAAIIPKGEYATVCLLGDEIDGTLVDAFFHSQAVRDCFPSDWVPAEGVCRCSPKINVGEVSRPFLDRLVLVGDCGVNRLYKDGIGGAYRTAKAAAKTAVFGGISAAEFEKHYLPTYRAIGVDNRFGAFIFFVFHHVRGLRPLLRGMLRTVAREQQLDGPTRRMSIVLWDMFTGSAPYKNIFLRTLDPRLIGKLLWETALALTGNGRVEDKERRIGTKVWK